MLSKLARFSYSPLSIGGVGAVDCPALLPLSLESNSATCFLNALGKVCSALLVGPRSAFCGAWKADDAGVSWMPDVPPLTVIWLLPNEALDG